MTFNSPGRLPSSRVAVKKEWEKRIVRTHSRI
jgi:hypothetical protein